MPAATTESTNQTTIDVPGGLYERVAQQVRRGAADSVSEFIVEAVENRLNKLRRGGFGDYSCAPDGSRFAEEGAEHASGPCDFDVMAEDGE